MSKNKLAFKLSRTNNNEAQWVVEVFLSKRERQQLLTYLSMDTAEALIVFKDENEVQLAKETQKDSAVILTMYPYPDLNEFYTLKDNCYAVIAVTHKDFEFETETRLAETERELLEKDIMATFEVPFYYDIVNKRTNEIEYGTLRIR